MKNRAWFQRVISLLAVCAVFFAAAPFTALAAEADGAIIPIDGTGNNEVSVQTVADGDNDTADGGDEAVTGDPVSGDEKHVADESDVTPEEGPEENDVDSEPVLPLMPMMAMAAPAQESPILNQTSGVSYDTIADALAGASAGDTILLSEGTFAAIANEQLRVTVPNLTIQGAGMDATVIDAGAFSCSGQAGLFVAADNVTIRNLTVRSSTTNGNVSALKYVLQNDAAPLAGGRVENVRIYSAAGHALNIHGVSGMVVSGVVVSQAGKLSISCANSPAISISNTTTCASSWGADIGIMYRANDVLYANPTTVTLGGGNSFANGGVFYSEKRTENDSDTVISSAGAIYKTWIPEKGQYLYLAAEPAARLEHSGSKTYFTTIGAALAQAQSGDSVVVTPGSYAEVIKLNSYAAQNVTLKAGGNVVLSGGISGGGALANFTIEGFSFVGKPISGTWYSASGSTMTIQNCAFTDITVPGDKLGSITFGSAPAGTVRNFVITGNTVTGGTGVTEPVGVYIQGANNVTITNNTFINIGGTALNLPMNQTGSVVISGNTFNNWAAYGDGAPGRAMRLENANGAVVHWMITGNRMTRAVGLESFVKLTNLTATSSLVLMKNYWGGMDPAIQKANGGALLAEVSDPGFIYPYYQDSALTTLRYNETGTVIPALIGKLESAVTAAGYGPFELSAPLTDARIAELTGNTAVKEAVTGAMDSLLRLDAAQVRQYLEAPVNAIQNAAVENLRVLYATAVKVASVSRSESAVEPQHTAGALAHALSATLPETLREQVTQQEVAAAIQSAVDEITAVQGTVGRLENALAGSLTQDSVISIKSVLEEIALAAEVQDDTVRLVPSMLVFHISPVIQNAIADENGGLRAVGAETPISNDQLNGSPINFRLAIPAGVTATFALVRHSASVGGGLYDETAYPIRSDIGGEKYIEITVTHFSYFSVTFYTPQNSPENPNSVTHTETAEPESGVRASGTDAGSRRIDEDRQEAAKPEASAAPRDSAATDPIASNAAVEPVTDANRSVLIPALLGGIGLICLLFIGIRLLRGRAARRADL